MLHIISILPCKITFGKTEIMNGIQQICFAHAIFATDTNNPLFEVKRLIIVVFELKQRYVLKTKH